MMLYFVPSPLRRRRDNVHQDMNMESGSAPSVTSSHYLRGLRILHGALLAGQVAFCIAAAVLVKSGSVPKADLPIPPFALYIIAAFPLLGYLAARTVLTGRLQKVRDAESDDKKLTLYKSALIFSWAVAEAGTIPAIILFLLTGDIYLLVMAAVGVGLFFMARPSRSRMSEDIGMSEW
jgi:hypothetical protein